MLVLFIFALAAAAYAFNKYQSTATEVAGAQSTVSNVEHSASKVVASLPFIGQFTVSQYTVQRIAQAVSIAEGFGPFGARPTRNNNPGDLKGNYAGIAIGSDADGFDIYATTQDGWTALYRQVLLWLTNKSGVASQETTIAELSQKYTTTQQDAWANQVARSLGVSIDTALGDV